MLNFRTNVARAKVMVIVATNYEFLSVKFDMFVRIDCVISYAGN